jgi:Subtilase family
MAAAKGRGKDGNAKGSSGNGTVAPMSVRDISEAQAAYVGENLVDVATYPARLPKDPDPPPVEFLYRRRHLLVRERDLNSVLAVIMAPGADKTRKSRVGKIVFPTPGVARIELLPTGPEDPKAEGKRVFGTIAAIEQQLGLGKAGVEYVLSVAPPLPPAGHCPATEPDPVPRKIRPQPGISRSCCDGRGTLVAVVDTGFIKEARNRRHPWLAGVTGQRDRQVRWGGAIERYGGHGTFIASIVRAMAPRAQVWAPRIFEHAGAIYEVDIVNALLAVLDRAPDVISLSAGTHTWMDRGLLTFQMFVNGPLRECKNTVLVSAAGNEGYNWKFSPAEMEEVVGVGALGPGDARAWFSNFGDWVKVFAPGQDLIHAFAKGTYRYQELRAGQQASFSGMARWSGTSFSTPVVSGLIAARMSGTRESAREAADSLLRLARAQALPDVGPVLHPGQACLCTCGKPTRLVCSLA